MHDVVVRTVVAGVLLLCGLVGLAAQAQPIRYVYDELGRLVAVIDQTGAAAIYTYDAVGNLLSITRQAAAVVSILEFSPNAGPVAQTVTVSGTGFSATPSQNTVTFNGVSATVTSSTTTQIVTSVPATATTGYIAVTTPVRECDERVAVRRGRIQHANNFQFLSDERRRWDVRHGHRH